MTAARIGRQVSVQRLGGYNRCPLFTTVQLPRKPSSATQPPTIVSGKRSRKRPPRPPYTLTSPGGLAEAKRRRASRHFAFPQTQAPSLITWASVPPCRALDADPSQTKFFCRGECLFISAPNQPFAINIPPRTLPPPLFEVVDFSRIRGGPAAPGDAFLRPAFNSFFFAKVPFPQTSPARPELRRGVRQTKTASRLQPRNFCVRKCPPGPSRLTTEHAPEHFSGAV